MKFGRYSSPTSTPWNSRKNDYAWIGRSLFDLFYGVPISDGNFKGVALERLIHRDDRPLPVKRLESHSGSSKQIDGSIQCGSTLIVIECRAIGRSLGFERGDAQAVKFRSDRITKALRDVDEKARWLRQNPGGRNYDVSAFSRIVPVAVTPFVEFIPSTHPRFWLTEKVPRVLTPEELHEQVEAKLFDGPLQNAVALS